MRKALFFTAYNRVRYLQQTLHTWESVRGLENWHVVFMIEPSEITAQVKEEFEMFVVRMQLTDYEIIVNPTQYGVLHHPYVGFQRLFEKEYEFVVRAEDDLIVSDDILEYFQWAAHAFRGDDQIATVQAFTHEDGPLEEARLSEGFSPWLWGTWRNRWLDLIGPTWDHDYSTFNGHPGNQAGWDWNLNTRIFPEYDLRSIVPKVARADNIGVYGTHGNESNFVNSQHFREHQPAVEFKLCR